MVGEKVRNDLKSAGQWELTKQWERKKLGRISVSDSGHVFVPSSE